jgi:Undecaprenyl-phosphate glucose phosphotransferase
MGGFVRKYHPIVVLAIRLADVMVAAAVFAVLHRVHFDGWIIRPPYLEFFLVSCTSIAVLHTLFYTNVLPRATSFWDEIKVCTGFVTAWFTFLLVLAFLFKVGHLYSREFFLQLGGLTWLAFVCVRGTIHWSLGVFRSKGYNFRTAIIVGGGPVGQSLVRRLSEIPWAGYRILGIFVDGDQATVKTSVDGVPVLPCYEKIPVFLRSEHVDDIFIALPLKELDHIREIVSASTFHSASVKLVPDMSDFFLLNHSVGEIGGIPVINITEIPLQGVNRLIKEGLDKLLAGMFLAILSPVIGAIAVGVKLSSTGPILFRQVRSGLNGDRFELLKFRTMYHAEGQEDDTKQAIPNDSRVTPFGRFLRRSSLDELPQLWNVLRGDMSIVGPRPHAIQHDDLFKDQVLTYTYRYKVKPGITGWAQVNGCRGLTDTPEKIQKRVEYDLYYIENWSFWFDLKIMGITMLKGLVGPNAY